MIWWRVGWRLVEFLVATLLVARWFGVRWPVTVWYPSLYKESSLSTDWTCRLLTYTFFSFVKKWEKDEQTSTAFWIMKSKLSSRFSFPSLKVGFRAGKIFLSNTFFSVTDTESPTFTRPCKLQKWHLVRNMIALKILSSLRIKLKRPLWETGTQYDVSITCFRHGISHPLCLLMLSLIVTLRNWWIASLRVLNYNLEDHLKKVFDWVRFIQLWLALYC